MKQSEEKFVSSHAKLLYDALIKKGVNAQSEYWDGHKTIDIAILEAKLYIEVDGLQHFIDPEQIIRDFNRNHYSDGDDFRTFYVTNQIIDKYLEDVVYAIVRVVEMKSR